MNAIPLNEDRMISTRRIGRALIVALLAVPIAAHAWWNDEWAHRKKIVVAAPPDVSAPVEQLAVPIRLHTGNFTFLDAKDNGSDLRFVAGDDKTPLKYHVERYDATNELAIVWVRVPKVAAGETIWMYYGNPKAAAGDDAKGTFDQAQTAVLHFGEASGLPKDATAYGNDPAQSSAKAAAAGWLGAGASFDGSSQIAWNATPALSIKGANGLTWTAWVRPTQGPNDATLFAQGDGVDAVRVALKGDRLTASVGAASAQATLPPGAWHHVAVSIGAQLVVVVDGKASTPVAVTLKDITAAPSMGTGFVGDIDEVGLANVARSSAWIAATFASQRADGTLISVGEPEDASGGGQSYFRILLGAVTLDGWVVIGILMVMMVIAFWVMITKATTIARLERANAKFRAHFAALSNDLTSIDRGDPDAASPQPQMAAPFASVGAMATRTTVSDEEFRHSSLYRVYHVGVRELQHRFELYRRTGQAPSLTPQAIAAIRASIDASLTRETLALNSKMVLLTIAISGGPFLGLLGTVVGVMITFAAIAAVGDVNVNSIAPGIAAALVATVAGLGVAIPSLFGYNWLASRVKEISTDMQVFVDEFITKLAESYAP